MTIDFMQQVRPGALGLVILLGMSANSTASEWRNILPMAAPGCASDAPYSFWTRPANPEKLAVIFPGGGACWNEASCNKENEHSNYDAEADFETDPTNEGGIFDLGNAKNPLKDHSFVVLPTCNGDVFLGDNVVTYKSEGKHGTDREFKIKHKGYANAMTAIEWATTAFPEAKDITVMGWSAGAIPSPLYTHILAQRFPKARISHVADGAGGYRVDKELDIAFENWGTANVFRMVPGFEDLAEGKIAFEDIYIRAAKLNPNINFHQLNIAHDYTQEFFLKALGINEPRVFDRIKTAQTHINSHVGNFRTYTVGGNAENIIGGYYDGFLNHSLQNNGKPYILDRLYSYQSNGVAVLDWINAAIGYQDVENVMCEDCETPKYTVVFEDEED